MTLGIGAALVAFVALTPPPATSAVDTIPDPLEAAGYDMEERMASLGVPGASVAVIEDGRIVWAEGYGVVEAGDSHPVTPSTRFQAGSISKPVAAVAALRLAEAGVVDLDAPVNRYLETWKLPENRLTEGEPVTLRRILTHRAGLTVHGFPGYGPSDSVPDLPEVLDGVPPANTAPVRVNARPGSQERYSGGGTTVMELLLEDVTGDPFPELMRREVLVPVGMEASTYVQPLPAELQGNAARAHGRNGAPVAGGWHVYPERAAAGLWTTAGDLVRLAYEVHRALSGEDGTLLSRASARAMVTAQRGSFGLGFQVDGDGRNAVFRHGGVNRGFEGLLVASREEPRAVAVLTNAAGGMRLAEEVAAAVAEGLQWRASR